MSYTETEFTQEDCEEIRLIISHDLHVNDVSNEFIQSDAINLAANIEIDANFAHHDELADATLLPTGVDEVVVRIRKLAMKNYAAYLLIDGYSDIAGENVGAGWLTRYTSRDLEDKKQTFLEQANSFIDRVYDFAPEDDPNYFRPKVSRLPKYTLFAKSA